MSEPEEGDITDDDLEAFIVDFSPVINKLRKKHSKVLFRTNLGNSMCEFFRHVKLIKRDLEDRLEENSYIISIKGYNKLNKEIKIIYMETCIPCMHSPKFKKGDCHTCEIMTKYTALQEKKRKLELL